MLFHLFLPFVTLLSTIAAVAFALPTTPLQDCSQTSPQPCECPAGTSYHTVTSYITLGVNAFDVRNLTADFYDLSWIPQSVLEKHGPDNTVGSTRKTVIAVDVGRCTWVEELIKYELGSDGSFLWAFTLKNVPVYFEHAPGRFEGEWVTFKADYVSEYETKISWNLYGCHTGGMHGYPGFQRMILKHVNSLLEADGKVKGNTSEPYSEVGLAQILSLADADANAYAAPAANIRGGGGVKNSQQQQQIILSDDSRARSSSSSADDDGAVSYDHETNKPKPKHKPAPAAVYSEPGEWTPL